VMEAAQQCIVRRRAVCCGGAFANVTRRLSYDAAEIRLRINLRDDSSLGDCDFLASRTILVPFRISCFPSRVRAAFL